MSRGVLDWLNEHFPRDFFDEGIARRALRHLGYAEKHALFSDDYVLQRTSEGLWYEFLVYEIMLDLSLRTDRIRSIVGKGADAPTHPVGMRPGQNGFYYSERGNLTVRGNGQNIAEMDLLFMDGQGNMGFVEAITSAMELEAFYEEIRYKKRLLATLLGQETVPFVLVSSVDISGYESIRRIAETPDNLILITDPIEDIRILIYEGSLRRRPEKSIPHPKRIDLTSIHNRAPFDYKEIHDRNRDAVVKTLLSHSGDGIDSISPAINPLSKKIMLGRLEEAGIKTLLRNRMIRIKDTVLHTGDVSRRFSRVVIAFDIPAYTPVIYFKVKGKEKYLKFIRNAAGDLVFQGRRTPAPYMSGFYEWLDADKPTIDPGVAERYASIFLSAN
ncbi:MAG: hypothetical protein WC083_07465 [Candidatus Methanomethylophilaceae archaeon]